MKLSDFKSGDRVQFHPATDLWMRGNKYGDVLRVGREKVHVKLDRSARIVLMLPENILEIIR